MDIQHDVRNWRVILLIAGLLTLLLPSFIWTKPLPRFTDGSVWHRDIRNAPLAADSAQMITTLEQLGGWGNGNRFQIDFSFHVLNADEKTPCKPVIAWPNMGAYYSPDCDNPGFSFPLTSDGAIEGSLDYTCNQATNDCHLLVVQGRVLYEAYKANVTANGVETRCAVRWNLDKMYPSQGRGEHCTSTDGAGFPIAPLLFNADEVSIALFTSDSDLGHAIRFTLPNSRIAASQYVHPSTHGTTATSAPLNSLPYGVRMRLKANFDMSDYSPAAKVILRTLQRYGLVLADGGNIALTAESDIFTNAKWNNLGINSLTFVNAAIPVRVTDFEVVETGARRTVSFDCTRVPEDFIFIDAFEY